MGVAFGLRPFCWGWRKAVKMGGLRSICDRVWAESVSQRLKPDWWRTVYGTGEPVPLSTTESLRWTKGLRLRLQDR